jgi:hypothetical protein
MRLHCSLAAVRSFNSCLQVRVWSLGRRCLTHQSPFQKLPSHILPRFPSSTRTFAITTKMDAQQLSHTQSMDELSATLSAVGISKVPQQPNTYPALNPVDIYRSHIAELLAPVAGVDVKIVFNALQWTNTLEKGDLVLAAPALRLKGKKPDELAKELAEKVVIGHVTLLVLPETDQYSFPHLLSSSLQRRTSST